MEEYHKSLKKNASKGKAPTKTLATQATHSFTALLAYTKLEVFKLKCGKGHFRLKAQRYTVGLKAKYHQKVNSVRNISNKLSGIFKRKRERRTRGTSERRNPKGSKRV